ncbi:PLP-dependent aminotransferase family protein [Bordetella sp. N]|uniref:aminotransferase-like domain-containing protein n=1 Tax=Bordetella sp. N TaxID=1746199 RepID=UPI00070FC5E9|nr:PLP-dependent aminotransferase family protein [Bordetella sp. N]ALM84262.1 hypothetical protein ASB57_15940 [Bordetella sp. N]
MIGPVPFHISLNKTGGVPLQKQICDQVRAAALGGRLQPGQQLSSSRELAATLGVARNTVADALAQLAIEGFLDIRQGRRPVVAKLGAKSGEMASTPSSPRPSRWATALDASDWPFRQEPSGVPLAPGMADPREFPHDLWARCLRGGARHAEARDSDDLNRQPLREALLAHLAHARGVRAEPHQLFFTPSAQAALDLCARLVLNPGDAAWMESPGYGGARAALLNAGATLHGIEVDAEGMSFADDGKAADWGDGPRPALGAGAASGPGPAPGTDFGLGLGLGPISDSGLDELDAFTARLDEFIARLDTFTAKPDAAPTGLGLAGATSLHVGAQQHRPERENPKAIFVTPSHQYPTGVLMSAPRRQALLDLARRTGAAILEDDYDSEFHYDGRPVAALQGLDTDGRVFHVGTFAKAMIGDVRVGYAIVPAAFADAFALAQRQTGQIVAPSLQAGLAMFIERGHLAAHIRRMNRIYRERRDCLVQLLRDRLGDRLQVQSPPGGMQALATLAGDQDDVTLIRRLASAGVGARPLSRHYVGTPARHGLLLGFAAWRAEEMALAVDKLAAAMDIFSPSME